MWTSKVTQLMCRMLGMCLAYTFLLETHMKAVGATVSFSGLLMNMQRFNEICILPSWTQLTSDRAGIRMWVLFIPDTMPVPPFHTFLNRKFSYKLKAENSFSTCPEESSLEIRLSSEMFWVNRERCYQLSVWLWVSYCFFSMSVIITGDIMVSGKPGV